jgi:hypothetical protein
VESDLCAVFVGIFIPSMVFSKVSSISPVVLCFPMTDQVSILYPCSRIKSLALSYERLFTRGTSQLISKHNMSRRSTKFSRHVLQLQTSYLTMLTNRGLS